MNYVFGEIVVDTAKVTLSKNAIQLDCEPRVYALLLFFCQHPLDAISREALITHVWDGRIVSDAAVNRAVGELRKLIEDDPSKPKWIKTISKVGYKFTVSPAQVDNRTPSSPSGTMSEALHGQFTTTPALQADKIEEHTADKKTTNRLLTNNTIWIGLTAVFFLFVMSYFLFFNQPKNTDKLSVEGWQPITTSLGSAFNPDYDQISETLLFLFRENSDAYAQVYRQNKSADAQSVTNDKYYYTDVIHGTEGFIFASRLNNLQQRHCEVVKIEPVSSHIEHIMDCGKGTVTQLGFDQEFNQLIFQARPSVADPYAIYSYQLDTGRKRQISHPIQQGSSAGDYVFALSPNGKILAVVEYGADDLDQIKLIDFSSNQIIASRPFINSVYGLVWRSNERLMASNSEGLYEFNVDDLSFDMTEQSDQFGRLALGGDKYALLTERSQLTINLFEYSDSGKTINPLTTSRGVSLAPVYGNNSNLLAFQSDRMGQNKIYIKPNNGATYVAEFAQKIEFISGMAWSPRDDKLVASINNALFIYSVAGKNWQPIAEQFSRIHHVTFAQENILFSAEVDGQWNIWQYELLGGEIKQLTFKGGYSVQGSGSTIYYTKFTREGLYQLDLNSDIESTVIPNFPITSWRLWQLRENKLFYLHDKTYLEHDLITAIESPLYRFDGRKPYSCNMSYRLRLFSCDQVELSTSHIWQVKLRH